MAYRSNSPGLEPQPVPKGLSHHCPYTKLRGIKGIMLEFGHEGVEF